MAGAITVASLSTIAPCLSTGTLTTGSSVDLDGTYQCEIDGPTADRLDVTGNLDTTTATLDFDVLSGGATQPLYIIASYGSLTGSSFSTVTDLSTGYSIDYSYNDGTSSNQIALVDKNLTAYSRWAFNRSLTFGVNDGPSATTTALPAQIGNTAPSA